MKRMKTLGLALVAVFAFAAFAASSSFGAVEVGRCVAKSGGKYTESNCIKKAGTTEKNFEFVKNAIKKGIHGSSGTATLRTIGGTVVTCTGSTISGELKEKGSVPSTKEVQNIVGTFTHCELELTHAECKSSPGEGAHEAVLGEIVTLWLEGPLGYLAGEKTTTPTVGEELKPMKSTTEKPNLKKLFAGFACGTFTLKVGEKSTKPHGNDCIIGEVQGANVMATSTKTVYEQAAGKQHWEHFQNKTLEANQCWLESNPEETTFERSTQEESATVESEEPLEFKA